MSLASQLAALAVTDSLQHASLPATFTKLPWSGGTGTISASGWKPEGYLAEYEGAKAGSRSGIYWNVEKVTGGNAATVLRMVSNTPSSLRQFAVWLFSEAGKTPSGYQLAAIAEGSGPKYKFLLRKWVAGVETLLAEVKEVSLEDTGALAVCALEGNVSVWVQTKEGGTFSLVSEVASVTFTEGYSGIDGNGSNPLFINFATGVVKLTTPTTAAARVISEPVDDRLFVKLTHADGSPTRWSGEEPEASGIPQGIKTATSAPGGFRDAGFSLTRDPRRYWPDLNLVDDVVIYGRTKPLGRNAFEGQMAHFPSELGDGFSIGVNAVGNQVLLGEDESWRALYVSLGFDQWGDPPLARLRKQAIEGRSSGEIAVSTGSDGIVWSPPHQALPVASETGVAYRGSAGLPVRKLGYRGKQIGDLSKFAAPVVQGDDSEELWGGEAAELTLDDTARVAEFKKARRYLLMELIAVAEVVPAVGTLRSLSRLAEYGDHGLTLRESEGGKELPGVYAHDALAHMLRTGAPSLKYKMGSNGTIVPNKNFVIPDLAFPEPGRVSEAVEKLNAYFLNNWAVWEDKYFHWHPWNPEGVCWDAKIEGGAYWSPAGRQSETLLNGMVVSYSDHAGVSRTAGPPGSGCDVESASLLDPDPSNPYTRRGRKRWGALQVDFTLAYGSTAVQVGMVRLLESRMPQRSGTLVIRPLGPGHIPQIEHPTIGPVPIWAVRAGEYVNLVDWPDPEPFRIIETDYDHDSKTLTAQLDNSSARMSAIMERVGIRQVGIVG